MRNKLNKLTTFMLLLSFLCSNLAYGAGVVDGQPVNAAITNAAFLYKNGNDSTPYTLGVTNTTDSTSTTTGAFKVSGGVGVSKNLYVGGTINANALLLTTPLPVASGGTGVSAVTTSPTASAWAAWDALKNFSANSILLGFQSITKAAGTTTLTVSSPYETDFVGATTQTLVLPVASTLTLGQRFYIKNTTAGNVQVNSSGGNSIVAMDTATKAVVTCILTSGTTAASWALDYSYILSSNGTVSSVGLTMPAAFTVSGSPVTGSSTIGVTYSGTAIPIANGGTAKTSVTTAPSASSWMGWDANKNIQANNIVPGFTTTATAAATTTLTVASTQIQQFTGSTTQTVKLPDATTLAAVGQGFLIINLSSGTVTVVDNASTTITTLTTGLSAAISATNVGSSAGTWYVQASGGSGFVAGINPTVQKFTSGTAQTYTTPSGVQFIHIRIVGGGGAGGGSSTIAAANGGAGSNGNASLWKDSTGTTTLLTGSGGNGGTAGAGGGNGGGTGGGASIGTGPIGSVFAGGGGASATVSTTNAGGGFSFGGVGGNSAFGGGGPGLTGTGGAGATNTGGGGGGAGFGGNNGYAGAGGGGGGTSDAIINSPAASYQYTVGASQTGGTAGTSGNAGGLGAAGYIEVTEYYTNVSVGTNTGIAAIQPTYSIATLTSHTGNMSANSTGTYTAPTGVQFIKVRIFGGGGGGAGSGVIAGTAAGSGGNSSFGTSLLAANGGGAGVWGNNSGAGGAVTLNSPAIGTALVGGTGQGTAGNSTLGNFGTTGGNGASTPLGGAGGGGTVTVAGLAAAANTGSGGGGGGSGSVASSFSGGGGSAGGYVEAIIYPTASQTFSYTVGSAGSAGVAGTGTGAVAGGAGAGGYIEVTEYYSNFSAGTTASVAANKVMIGPTSGAGAGPTFRNLVAADLPATVALNVGFTSASTPTANTVLKYDTTITDTNSGWSVSTGLYTVPVGLGGKWTVSVTGLGGATANLYIKITGTATNTLVTIPTGLAASGSLSNITLLAGDTIGIYTDTTVTLTAKSGSVGYFNTFTLTRVGP